ncbi:MAG: CHAT domain-containing protein, partial [Nostoc sp. C3-bin3]|nr:CHAT domain-containing protein [Nostoc sp. C3-bin3]
MVDDQNSERNPEWPILKEDNIMNIKSTIFVSAFSILCFWIPNDALANHTQKQQTQNQSDIAALFDQAAAKHQRELHNLLMSRGASSRIYLGSQASSERVGKVLAVNPTNINRSTEDRGYPDDAIYLDKTAILFYSYDKETLQIWLVDEDGIQAYHKRKISENEINEAITTLRNSMGVDSLQSTRSPHPRGLEIVSIVQKSKLLNRSIAELTEILLPVALTHKLSSVRHLIIVPVLGFGTVPYAVLQPFKDGSFLIDKMSLSVAPSLFDVGQSIPPWNVETAFSSPLIVGNPYLPTSTEWIVPTLLGAEKEALTIAETMNATPIIGKQAKKETILSKVRNSSLLYFATHGVASNSNPLSGGFLMFSAETLQQGWWTAKEVQETYLR